MPSAKAPVKRTVAKRKALGTLPRKSALQKHKAAAVCTKDKKHPKAPTAKLQGVEAVVINLDTRPDRWLSVQKSVAKQAPWLPVRRLPAVDGRAAPPPVGDVSQKWSTARLSQLFFWYKSVTIKMSPGERGCCASHVAAWRLAARLTRPLLVLEDDAAALPSFTASITQAVKEAPADTGMIFLSSKDRGTPKRFGKVLMEPHYVWTTVGYLIYPEAAKKLLRMRPLDMPVDNFLAWHIKEGAVKAFSLRPAAVRQAQTWNIGSDVPHSDDVAHR
uniref:Glycosyl transferase family 25 domain-containing protein n=1 Tax=Alexandrium catenella TaxID=2925 RepID=A0A7S1M273_ALECA